MTSISKLEIVTTSLVSKENLQKIILTYKCSETAHLFLSIYRDDSCVLKKIPIAVGGGYNTTEIMLPIQADSFVADWEVSDASDNVLIRIAAPWTKPREWTLYIMVSSHTDIGLHNSQYIQRYNSERFIDMAADLCDETANKEPNDRYRYTMEGTWFWNNYGMDRGKSAAERIVKEYIHTGRIGACAGVAGNHIQTYGLEEMCRSTYEKRLLEENWGIQSKTLAMVDNNGMPMSMIQAYADAGYENIIFSPNHWNPFPSKIWKADRSKHRYVWNTAAGGGGSRADVRLESNLPMVFNWENSDGKKLTVWACSQYSDGFGFFCENARRPFRRDRINDVLAELEDKMWKNLLLLEEKFPFDIWLTSSYWDDQEPSSYLINQIQAWNQKWEWPKVRTLGDPNEPFEQLREHFGENIPVLKGDITGGWYQHPLSVPELMSMKFEADRALPNAEKWASVAGMTDENYTYPATDFRRAWDYLLFNDEHSYGTSGYCGRRVYETWMQHRDWINKATETADVETKIALQSIASNIEANEDSVVVFNPTSQERTEIITSDDENKYSLVSIPAFGYYVVPNSEFSQAECRKEKTSTPPIIENDYYKICFSENGSMCSIFDKELGREILDSNSSYSANELIYTRDNHKSFETPSSTTFEISYKNEHICVKAQTEIAGLGADIVQTVTLPKYEKRIDIDNELHHVKDMINSERYYRYLYYAFPFSVENSRRLCHMNGDVAEYAKDVTGHGTDVYMEVNEWCSSENDDFGVALMMRDTHVVEFDHIHPEKTDFGAAGSGSQIFVYAANDWLQAHSSGGSHLNYRFRFSITSYTGGYKDAKVPQKAERFVNPVQTMNISAQSGKLPRVKHSFLELPDDLRLICLKRADDGKGIIARFYGASNKPYTPEGFSIEPATIDERAISEAVKKGFITYRLGKESISLKTKEPVIPTGEGGAPAPIGSVYTGLITKPCAVAGENDGHLYLVWGANAEKDFSHYKLYRSEIQNFIPGEDNFIADVLPEEYVVGRYEDTELKTHTCYYYRVCAVNNDGLCGEMSDEFCAYTREVQSDMEESK